MITKGVKVLVVAAIDGECFTEVLNKAADEKISVIAYDRLILNSDHVSYYATFDSFKVGVLQASYIEEKLGLKDGKWPFNIDLFAVSPDDNNAYFFFNGAMSVFQPYIDSGKVVVKSSQTQMEQTIPIKIRVTYDLMILVIHDEQETIRTTKLLRGGELIGYGLRNV